jgi:P27 family predicted phage terminase small subunit
MKRGPRPEPTHLKLLRGNPSQHYARAGRRGGLNLNEPQAELIADIPEPPPFLIAYACDEWRIVAAEMYHLGLLAKVDLPSLAAYCYSYGQWRTAAEAIARMAAGDPVMSGLIIKTKRNGEATQNPLVPIARKAALDMVRYASEFGFTPAARSRIDAGPGGSGPGKFDGFLAG